MPDLQFERIFRLRNFPAMDIRVVVASTEGALVGAAQTGGRMQIILATPKAVIISAGVYGPLGTPRGELPRYVTRAIQDAGRSVGPAACFASKFSVSCTIEHKSVTQGEALKILEDIGRRLEQQVAQVEIVAPRGVRG